MDRRAQARPPRSSLNLHPSVATIPVGSRLLSFVRSIHRDALGAGPGRSRFSDPMLDRGRTPRWLPMYFGETFTLCLQETLLRDRANATLPGPFLVVEAESALWGWAVIEVTRPLRVVDLRGAALARSRVPTDVLGAANQRLTRFWAAAVHRYPANFDGIAFRSRFRTVDNLALFQGRVGGTLRVAARRPGHPRCNIDSIALRRGGQALLGNLDLERDLRQGQIGAPTKLKVSVYRTGCFAPIVAIPCTDENSRKLPYLAV